MLRKVEPPSVDPEIKPTAPYPQLTARVYEGLDALIDFHTERRAKDDAFFWTLVRDKLHRVPVADRHLAYAVAGGLEDGLAWEYDAQGWPDVAEGWREASRVVRRRADAREACQ